MFKKGHIDIISLGCAKNLVDAERLLKRLQAKGYNTHFDPQICNSEYVIVNTCGFISDAKIESINTILQLVNLKQNGKIGKIIVMGCLSQRYLDDLKKEIPEVDLWYGKFDWNKFVDTLPDLNTVNKKNPLKIWERSLTTPPFSTYLKIAEGCDRYCTFCAIPLITGRYKSRPIDEIIEEVNKLASEGVREYNIIAQDLSSYGKDIYGEVKLAELIERISHIDGVEWIRLHYAYPAGFPKDILDVMANNKKVCKYLDIALQHIYDPVLSNMKRHINKEETHKLLEEIRDKVPGIKIRTTLMVGFPGEDEKGFGELLDFVKEQKFDRLGAFAYSEEDDTVACKNLEDSISEEIKQKRLEEIMEVQNDISLDLNKKMIGTVQKVLIDRIEGNAAIGRTEFDSPEVDNEVFIEDANLVPGEFVNVKIIDALPYELIGKIEL